VIAASEHDCWQIKKQLDERFIKLSLLAALTGLETVR
jgi:hypothetical protein